MSIKNFLVTGRPGIGKTTAVSKVVELLRRDGYKVGGFISKEVRERGRRIGFEVINLRSEKRGWLARVGGGYGPRIGKYTVDLKTFEDVGVKALEKSLIEDDVLIIDEIGPMELFSSKFKDVTWKALESTKPVVATIHWKANRDSFGRKILARDDIEIIELTLSNRDRIPLEIYKKIINKLTSQ
ncbi:MAG: nucleoside triphosphatase [Thermoprotei archaeon]|nr:MAG: nucleoside triphosphatase [Thermoprotei archaeon]